MARCVERVPVSLAGGILEEPHFLQETTLRHDPVTREVTRFYLVDGTRRQLILSCEAEWPSARHPMAGFLVQRSRDAISRQFNECKRAVFDGAMVAAIDRN